MKLWIKISLLTGAVMLFAMGAFFGALIYETWQYNLNQTIESNLSQMNATARGIAREIDNSSLPQYGDVTRNAFLRYLMKRYGRDDYMLLQEGAVICNLTEYDLLPGNEGRWQEDQPEYVIQRTAGRYILVVGQTLSTQRSQEYQLVLVKDISGIYEDVTRKSGIFCLILFLVLFFAVDMIFWLVKRQLKPLGELEKTAVSISQGDYGKRVRVRTRDEVGKVGNAFNQMAEQIEEQMGELETVSERRRQLLGGLTHELRTPMTSIIGYSDTLMNVKLTPEQQKRALGHINAECHRLERLSGKLMNLLGMYDDENIMMEEYSMQELFGRVAKLETYRLQEAGIELVTDCRMGSMRMDVDLMESLLVNLLDNAIKASAPGSRIEMKAMANVILVRDYGKGIPKEEISKVTEAFYMVDKSRSKKAGGIGLGLALCQRIAQIHHAELSIESELGQGTSVYVMFLQQPGHRG
ncbi:MAG: ATP-binding protein [Candidatus Limivivens sp.]|nr:ATP-binding protein [Candidatus Limivivens sp.]